MSSESLPSLYQGADILLIAYQQDHHEDQANPHKMMEYLGSGRMVVCTHTTEYIAQKDLLAMSESNEEWSALFANVVGDLSKWNSEELKQQRTNFAMENTYYKQLETIASLLK